MYTTIAPTVLCFSISGPAVSVFFCGGRSKFCQLESGREALLAGLVEGGCLTGLATGTGSWPGNVVGRSSGSPAVITLMTAVAPLLS